MFYSPDCFDRGVTTAYLKADDSNWGALSIDNDSVSKLCNITDDVVTTKIMTVDTIDEMFNELSKRITALEAMDKAMDEVVKKGFLNNKLNCKLRTRKLDRLKAEKLLTLGVEHE